MLKFIIHLRGWFGYYFIPIFGLGFLLISCTSSETDDPLFKKMSPEQTGIDFENRLEFTRGFNIYNYRNFYDGGGVAVGDVTGNGFPDIYFINNLGDNRLYKNLGDFKFEDITDTAGVAGNKKWSTGAAMADINGDGLLDMYVMSSGELDDRRNELFINNGDGSFTEMAAEYGLDDPGYSIHATFFDYNNDGRVDLYLINNADEAIGSFDLENNLRNERDYLGGDRLYRNDGETFTDVTDEAGIYSSIIGFALSASVADLNRNGLYDIFIANDFFERDYLYMNNGDGTFDEVIDDDVIRSMSAASMGSDIADINNNGWPDIYVTDMLPDDQNRIKSVTIFEDWPRYREKVDLDYGHQFTRNMLHVNQGNGHFLETSRYSGVHATDWSWATLLADLDNNGYNDIFVSNGLVQDITNLDYLEEISDSETMRGIITEQNVDFERLVDIIPSNPIQNFVFSNRGDLQFDELTSDWGLDEPGFSSGVAWADLNGNGSLDLIVNNTNSPARIYRNRTSEHYPDRAWLRVNLDGEAPNTHAIGAQLQVWSGENHWYREHILQRGFQSSMQPGLFVGLGETSRIDSLVLRWPDGRTSRLQDIEVPSVINLSQSESENSSAPSPPPALIPGDSDDMTRYLNPVDIGTISDWSHIGYTYNDFTREPLLMRMRSTEGPAMCTGDINGDGLSDLYLGGAREQSGSLFIQNNDGSFSPPQRTPFENDANSEDVDCEFFDATGNGLADLYVVSGGNSFSSGSSALLDRFYMNEGDGVFVKTEQPLPTTRGFEPGSVVASHDFNKDGNMDLFVGTRLKPFAIGLPVNGYLLAGDGEGGYTDVTEEWAPGLLEIGMITDALWADITGNNEKELVIVGEWMPVTVFSSDGSGFKNITEELGFNRTSGWWNAIAAGDIDGNGRIDLVGANHGSNSMFRPKPDYPVQMWVNDFEENGVIGQILTTQKNGKYYPVALRHDLIEELPSLREKYPDYSSYAGQTVDQIFSEEKLNNANLLRAEILESSVFWNKENNFEIEKLPVRAQLTPLYDVHITDISGNGNPEIILGGNLYNVKPQTGPYDAGRGVIVSYSDGAFQTLHSGYSGLNVPGEIRNINTLHTSNGRLLIISRYNESPVIKRID